MTDHVLVVGGAGYIGSCCAKLLAQGGYTPVVFDNLSTGHRSFARFGPFVEGDILDPSALDRAMTRYRPRAVCHFAALSIVRDSTQNPLDYFDNNVAGSLNLLRACVEHDVRTLVFSSTAAVYGEAKAVPVPLDAPLKPVNPYGTSKRVVVRSSSTLGATIFRYFNAAGAHPDADVGEWHEPETHLIPNALRAVQAGATMNLYGDDYDTPDGTCVRDYVHVVDLVRAHIAALASPSEGGQVRTFNLGSGQGFSVRSVLEACGRVIGRPVQFDVHPRRPGDPPRLVAGDLDRAAKALRWTPKHSTIDQIVSDAWRWQQKHGHK
ncbi:MAG: UDP-glucose 4-epimerase GalE [Myxococcota bacterium]